MIIIKNLIGKLVLAAVLIIAILVGLVISDIVFLPIKKDRLHFIQRFTARQINKKWETCLERLDENKRRVVGYSEMESCLNPLEGKFMRRVFSINPNNLGFMGSFFSKEEIKELEVIPSAEIVLADKKIETGINFMPYPVFGDYSRMMEAMKKDLGKSLLINSGYRSPGYQAYLFFFYLVDENNYSLAENAKWVAMPGYSEHGCPNTALDFITTEGISGEEKGQTAEDFERTQEFGWLIKNANSYNFYLTYPPGNPYGVSYEPWHWHWEKKS